MPLSENKLVDMLKKLTVEQKVLNNVQKAMQDADNSIGKLINIVFYTNANDVIQARGLSRSLGRYRTVLDTLTPIGNLVNRKESEAFKQLVKVDNELKKRYGWTGRQTSKIMDSAIDDAKKKKIL